jgi:ABC-type multidrug transport system fused ATPase/permease subunit
LNGLTASSNVMAVVEAQCIIYCYLALAAGAAGFAQAWGFSLLSERLSHRLRRAYLAALLATEMQFYDAASSGELVARLASDVVRALQWISRVRVCGETLNCAAHSAVTGAHQPGHRSEGGPPAAGGRHLR